MAVSKKTVNSFVTERELCFKPGPIERHSPTSVISDDYNLLMAVQDCIYNSVTLL